MLRKYYGVSNQKNGLMGWSPLPKMASKVPKWIFTQFHKEEVTEMNITRVGIDLAKNVIQVHGVDDRGMPVLKKQLKRSHVLAYFANLPLCQDSCHSPAIGIIGNQTGGGKKA